MVSLESPRYVSDGFAKRWIVEYNSETSFKCLNGLNKVSHLPKPNGTEKNGKKFNNSSVNLHRFNLRNRKRSSNLQEVVKLNLKCKIHTVLFYRLTVLIWFPLTALSP